MGGGLAGESEVRGGRGLELEGFGRLGVFVEAGGVVFVLVLVLVLVCLCVCARADFRIVILPPHRDSYIALVRPVSITFAIERCGFVFLLG